MLKRLLLPLLIIIAIALFFIGDRWNIPAWVPVVILLATCPIAMSSMHGHGDHESEHGEHTTEKHDRLGKN